MSGIWSFCAPNILEGIVPTEIQIHDHEVLWRFFVQTNIVDLCMYLCSSACSKNWFQDQFFAIFKLSDLLVQGIEAFPHNNSVHSFISNPSQLHRFKFIPSYKQSNRAIFNLLHVSIMRNNFGFGCFSATLIPKNVPLKAGRDLRSFSFPPNFPFEKKLRILVVPILNLNWMPSWCVYSSDKQ